MLQKKWPSQPAEVTRSEIEGYRFSNPWSFQFHATGAAIVGLPRLQMR
jgi:hypothetical protein